MAASQKGLLKDLCLNNYVFKGREGGQTLCYICKSKPKFTQAENLSFVFGIYKLVLLFVKISGIYYA